MVFPMQLRKKKLIWQGINPPSGEEVNKCYLCFVLTAAVLGLVCLGLSYIASLLGGVLQVGSGGLGKSVGNF